MLCVRSDIHVNSLRVRWRFAQMEGNTSSTHQFRKSRKKMIYTFETNNDNNNNIENNIRTTTIQTAQRAMELNELMKLCCRHHVSYTFSMTESRYYLLIAIYIVGSFLTIIVNVSKT